MHLIYISIILFLIAYILKILYLLGITNKRLIKTKESMKVPYDIFSNYEKAYVNFYKWMIENNVDKKVIDKYEEMFKYEDRR